MEEVRFLTNKDKEMIDEEISSLKGSMGNSPSGGNSFSYQVKSLYSGYEGYTKEQLIEAAKARYSVLINELYGEVFQTAIGTWTMQGDTVDICGDVSPGWLMCYGPDECGDIGVIFNVDISSDEFSEILECWRSFLPSV